MGQKLCCGDRDVGVGGVARALKGALRRTCSSTPGARVSPWYNTNEAAEDDAADELGSGSRGSMRSKKFGRHSSLRSQSNRKLSIDSSFVGGGGNVLRPRQKYNLEVEKQLNKKAKTAEMA